MTLIVYLLAFVFILDFCFYLALFPGGEEKAVSGGLGYTHPEDLSWLEVSHAFPAPEEESGGGGRLVPQIRCRFIFFPCL